MSLYTSRSEFDLEKRVHFTNEIPPYDMFGGLNSVLQTDLWKWILGFTDVEFGLPYAIDTITELPDGTIKEEKSHEAGIDNGEVYYKMVNGKIVDDVQYGPGKNENKNYHRLEEYGVLLPEFDFLLHEVYRYLGTMYPDHPDMIELLTDNEFNDMVASAAAVIDYKPDVSFFDTVASSLNMDTKHEEQIEAAMLKIRNLKNEGFRKRVYGSKMGYRMLSSDIFQNVSVFPVATYLPLKPIDKNQYLLEVGTNFMKDEDGEFIKLSDYNREVTRLENLVNVSTGTDLVNAQNALNAYKEKYIPVSPMVDEEQLKEWNQKNGYSYNKNSYNNHIRQHNRIIDTYSKYYNKKFRLVDYDGSNSSYPEPKDLNKYAFGYSLPFNEWHIFEVPACPDTESLMVDFDVSNEIKISEYDTNTNYIRSKGDDIPLTRIKIDYDVTFGNRLTMEQQKVEEIHNIETTIKNFVPYKKLFIYPPLSDAEIEQDCFEAIKVNGRETFCNDEFIIRNYERFNFLSYYYSTYLGKGFTKEKLEKIVKSMDVVYNPLIEDTLYMNPSTTISFYPHSVDIKKYSGTEIDGTLVINPEYNGNFYIPETGIVWDKFDKNSYLAMEDLSVEESNTVGSMLQVTNFTKGYIDIEIDSGLATENAQIFNITDNQKADDRFGIVVENEEGNLIVLEGKMTAETVLLAGRYNLSSEYFNIAAIPKIKTNSMMRMLYGNDYEIALKQTSLTGLEDTHQWTVKDYVKAYVDAGFDESVARDYYSDDDDVYRAAKDFIDNSDKDYTQFLEYVKQLMQYEENLAAWRENSSYLYRKVKYVVDGEEKEIEQALVQPGCNVVAILSAGVSMNLEVVPETVVERIVQPDGTIVEQEVFNEVSYQNKVDYAVLDNKSGYLPGVIKAVSLGNLNVVTIYGNNGQAQYIPTTPEVETTTLNLTSPDNQTLTFHYVRAVDRFTIPDKTTILDDVLNEKEIYDHYKQSLSIMDTSFKDYAIGRKSEDFMNLTASTISREIIKIESVIDISHEGYENVIFFESDIAREMFKSLSVGDIVTGPSIDSDDNDVYITHIGDNEITVNVKLQQSGTFVLSYYVKTNISPSEITDDLLQYKENLYKNGLYSVSNPFEHGLWPSDDFPKVSTAILDSLPDISFYNIYNFISNGRSSFTKVLEDTHYDEYTALEDALNSTGRTGSKSKYLMASDIKFNNELFLEFNLNKLIYFPSQKSGIKPILMSVKWLDYIENSLMSSSRSTDNVNVGVNVMLETDTTGYYTLISNNNYTDPQIRLKFITLNLDGQNMWPERSLGDVDWVTPCYAQVGNGGSGRKDWFKSPDDVNYPSVWGIKTFDDIKDARTYDEESDFYKEDGRLKDVSVYGQDTSELNQRINTVKYTDVESPLFEIPLGEYDTVTKYVYDSGKDAKNLLSITQASFYSQAFTNIMKYINEDEKVIKIISNDFTKNDVLIGYGDDGSNTFTYGGVWTPTKTTYYDNNGNPTNFFELVYPENPSNYQYFVVTEDINLSNIAVIKNGVITPETRTFNRADILFYYKNKWFVKGFQYLGLVGDGFDTIYLDGNDIVRKCLSPESNLALSQQGESAIESSPYYRTYYYTLKERLIQYYIRAAKTQIDESNYTKIIRNTGFGDKYYYTNPIDNSSGVNLVDSLKEMRENFAIHKHTILYWIYAGTFSPDSNVYSADNYWPDTRDRDWLKEVNGNDYTKFFNVGDRIALANFNDGYSETPDENAQETGPEDWFIFKVNMNSLLGMSLPVSKWRDVKDEEYNVIIDKSEYLDDEQKCGIQTYVSELNTTINLPRGYITEGSYNFNLTVDPHFISTGYLYTDDGLSIRKNTEVKFCTTKGAIYYDSDNDAFYTFSNLLKSDGTFDNKTTKVAIKFNEQKFFKNTLKMPCIYQTKNTLVSGEQTVKQTPTLTGIMGLDFPIDKLSVGDRLLEVQKLDLRSNYSTSLEPVFFSNYFDVNYPIKGITRNNELYLSYIPDNPTNSTEKLNFTVDIMGLIPIKNVFDEQTNTYNSSYATDSETITFGSEFDNPVLSKIAITKPLLSDTYQTKTIMDMVNRNFAFFKNNLVVRGKVNTANPRSIMIPNVDSNLFRNAVENISIGDSLVGAYALEPTGNEDKLKISIVNGSNGVVDNARIQYAYFANGQFRAVQKDGVIYFNNEIDVANVTSSIDCRKSVLFDNADNELYRGEVKTLGWSADLGWYVEIVQSGRVSVICRLDILEATDSNGNYVSRLSQAYMSTGNHIFVDYEGNKHTLVGHVIGEFENDKTNNEWNEYTYNGGDVKYTYEKSDQLLPVLNEQAVVTGLGKQFNYSNGQNTEDEIRVLYRDLALLNAKLTQDTDDTKVYNLDEGFVSEPYNVDTVRTTSSNVPISSSLMSRSILKTDNSGKYTVYAKGRSLFVKSPTSLVEKKNSGYGYNGFLTANSYWKLANAPIFDENMFLTIRSTLVNDKSGVDSLVDISMMRQLELLGNQVNLSAGRNAGITVDGRTISYSSDNTMFENVKAVFAKVSGYTDYTSDSINFANKVTFAKTAQAMDKAKANPSKWYKADGSSSSVAESSINGYPLVVRYQSGKWIFRCNGFKLIEETVKNGLDVIGASKQTIAEIAPNVSSISSYYTEYELEDNMPLVNYEYAYAKFAYYYVYYFCGNAENTDIINSSNISDIQFTDSNMIVTDMKGNISSIGLCYLHNRDSIEDSGHWATASIPKELSFYSVDSDLTGFVNYKVNGHYLSIPKPNAIVRQNTFSIECSYANDEIILLGGYIYSKTDIENIYDNFFKGQMTDEVYQNWKSNRSSESIDAENQLLAQSKFQNVGTPVLLYSVDKGSSFNRVNIKSTSGKSLEWEGTTAPSVTYTVSSVVYAENEYKVFVNKINNRNENLQYYYYISQNDNGLFDFTKTTGSKDMDQYGDISRAHEFDIDSTTGTNDFEEPSATSLMSSINSIPTGNYRMMFTEGEDSFYILSSKSINFGPDVVITAKATNALTVSMPLTAEGDSEFDVLLAFNTKKNIKDSLSCLNMNRALKYVNAQGSLYVPEVTEVEDSSKANRFYSYRELLNPEKLDKNSTSYDPYGYPALIEDTGYSMYEYNDSYDSSTGKVVKTPKFMQNSNGDIIYLCDATGKYYIFVDKATNRRVLGTISMRGSYSLDLFQPAYKTAFETLEEAESNPDVRIKDDTFESKLGLTTSNIISFNYGMENPYIKISTQKSDLARSVSEYLFSDNNEFLSYLQTTTNLLDSNTLITDDPFEVISGITYDTGRVDSFGISIYEQRFTLSDVYTDQSGTHSFWYDNLTETFPLNKKRYLSALAFVPYCFEKGITAYRDLSFEDVSESGRLPNPITGVYLSNYGYGGSRSNHGFWENTVPWLVDPDAFVVGDYLKNSIGEPIYMVDASGEALQSYDAEQVRNVGDRFTIPNDFLGNLLSKDLYVYSDSNNVYKKDIKFLKAGKTFVYTPIKELVLGTQPFELSFWTYQSYKLQDIDDTIKFRYYGKTSKTEYDYVLCGGTGVPKPDFWYDPDTKRICYRSSDILANSFYISPKGEVDVSELVVSFTMDGVDYEQRFAITFEHKFNTDSENRRYIEIRGDSTPSIYFDSYAVYNKQESKYNLTKVSLNNTQTRGSKISFTNKTLLSLTVSKHTGLDGHGVAQYESQNVSVLDVSSETVLGTSYDGTAVNINTNTMSTTTGALKFNLQPATYIMVNTVKLYVSPTVLTVQLPIFMLGSVKTFEDYLVDMGSVRNGSINVNDVSGEWLRKTYVDNVCLNDLDGVQVEYDETTLNVSLLGGGSKAHDDTDALDLGRFYNKMPDVFINGGYYFNLPDGSVITNDTTGGLSAQLIKLYQYDDDELDDTVYVNGSYGKLICRKPVYNNFQDLLYQRGFVIDKGSDSVLYSRADTDTLTVGMTDTEGKSVSLTEMLDIDGFNDGKEHAILMKWLTQSTVKMNISLCNSDSDFVELNNADKVKFPPDRIWFNPDGYPVPPVVIGNSVYNSDNNEQYTGDTYKNNNGYSIYRCNEKGHLVGYTMTTDQSVISKYKRTDDSMPEGVEGYIKDSNGNIGSILLEYELSPHGNTLSDAQIPNKPNYDTCQDWFKNEFFIKGHESNPYWQVLNISSFFNKNHVWEQRMTVNEYARSTQQMVMKQVDESDCYIVPQKTTRLDIKNDTCIIVPSADPVDRTAGSINFVLDKPAIKYQTEKQFIKYGITAQNPFYESSVWDGTSMNMSGYLDSTYTVCSTKNLADPRDKESEIQEVTEFGLFNKYHQLIAYATFPPIEYRTSTQHISFTAYVKQGSCIDPKELVSERELMSESEDA